MERWARDLARRVSRRRFLGSIGALLCGAATMPLLPVARGETPRPAAGGATDPGDPQTCEYWRHCAIDGFLCSCCGGSVQSCPPGTEASAVTWVGTCHNPGDGTRLHRFVQRLLRQDRVRALSVQPQRGRQAALHAVQVQRLQLVRRQQGRHRLPLLHGAHRRRREVNARVPGAAAALLAATATWAAAPANLTPKPQADYMLNCQGCHLPDGTGAAGKVPSLRTSLTPLAQSAAGRPLPGAGAGRGAVGLSDAELAQVLNWMVRNLSARPPPQWREFTAQEVTRYRATPLVAVRATRARLLGSAP